MDRKKFLLFLTALGLGFISISIFFTFFKIYSSVKTACLKSKGEFGGECGEALIKLIKAENHSFQEKNSAIWALGQLADKKALPFLEELNKSLPKQDECRYQEYLCKYEIEKAIKWCQQGNLTSWMYKNRESW